MATASAAVGLAALDFGERGESGGGALPSPSDGGMARPEDEGFSGPCCAACGGVGGIISGRSATKISLSERSRCEACVTILRRAAFRCVSATRFRSTAPSTSAVNLRDTHIKHTAAP